MLGRVSQEFGGEYGRSSVEPKEKRELGSNWACGLHAACGLEQGEGVSVGVLEDCIVSHCRDFLFCSDELFVWGVAFEESAHGLVCRCVFVGYEPVFLFSPFGELPAEKLLVELAHTCGVIGGYFEVN